jgi:hypothetical protein
MKYLTKKRWAGTRTGEQANASGADAASWGKALRAYRGQLEAMRPRLPDHVFAFFDRADIHEGELLHLEIRDGSRPAPLDQLPRPWIVPGDHPVRVELAILDVYDRQVWTLQYRSIRRILVDFPSKTPLFYQDGEGFGDVGCHELTDCGDGFFRHEILFATGATLLVEFKDIEVQSRPRPHSPASSGSESQLLGNVDDDARQ